MSDDKNFLRGLVALHNMACGPGPEVDERDAEIERLQAVVDAARRLRDFENTHNTADGDGFLQREEILLDITEAVRALDGEVKP